VLEPDLQRRIVGCRHAYGALVGDLALMKFFRVHDIEEAVGILGCRLRIEQPLPGVFEIPGADFFPVAPRDIVSKMKDDFFPAFENVPRFGDHRSGL